MEPTPPVMTMPATRTVAIESITDELPISASAVYVRVTMARPPSAAQVPESP